MSYNVRVIKVLEAYGLEEKDVKIVNVKKLEQHAHKRTFITLVKDNNDCLKHYIILDNHKLLSIPVLSIKSTTGIVHRKWEIPFSKNIGLLEIKREAGKTSATLYNGNISRKLYF